MLAKSIVAALVFAALACLGVATPPFSTQVVKLEGTGLIPEQEAWHIDRLWVEDCYEVAELVCERTCHWSEPHTYLTFPTSGVNCTAIYSWDNKDNGRGVATKVFEDYGYAQIGFNQEGDLFVGLSCTAPIRLKRVAVTYECIGRREWSWNNLNLYEPQHLELQVQPINASHSQEELMTLGSADVSAECPNAGDHLVRNYQLFQASTEECEAATCPEQGGRFMCLEGICQCHFCYPEEGHVSGCDEAQCEMLSGENLTLVWHCGQDGADCQCRRCCANRAVCEDGPVRGRWDFCPESACDQLPDGRFRRSMDLNTSGVAARCTRCANEGYGGDGWRDLAGCFNRTLCEAAGYAWRCGDAHEGEPERCCGECDWYSFQGCTTNETCHRFFGYWCEANQQCMWSSDLARYCPEVVPGPTPVPVGDPPSSATCMDVPVAKWEALRAKGITLLACVGPV